ncbi:MAG: 1-acyl-sn-glycerol-3-phosphate acyltransferase [Anaerolineales bacterium]|nr:1-acyl-sn-glycerol-3-phosphate acyltransferase [Anaerolineales bacterium]
MADEPAREEQLQADERWDMEASTDDAVQPYRVSWWLRLRRRSLQILFRGVFHLLCKVKVVGIENVPPEGPYLLALNHISLFDPPLVLSFWPYLPEALGASDLIDRPGISMLMRSYQGIPVHRGQYDRKVIDTALRVLAAGNGLLIAPEGGRSHDIGMRQANPGIAYLVEKTGVPIVPVGAVGTTDDMLKRALRLERPHVEMRVGELFHLPPIEGVGKERREARQRNADTVMLKIAELLPEEYHGYYAGQVTGWPQEGR